MSFVQPPFTRPALPQIGGAAAVWTMAMLFFQTVLIGGYLYAHIQRHHIPTLVQVVIRPGLLLLALFFLPLAIPAGWQYDPVMTRRQLCMPSGSSCRSQSVLPTRH